MFASNEGYGRDKAKFKIDGNVLKGSNQDLKKIPRVPCCKVIQKLFLSNNEISSLSGIETYKSLKVLSLGYNNIGNQNELPLLYKLPLQTLTLENNPISKYPFYSHRVINAIPTLLILDGNQIDDTIRKKAQRILEKEEEILNSLYINEMKIESLERLLEEAQDDPKQIKTAIWLQKAKRVIESTENVNFKVSIEEKEEKFNLFREDALRYKIQRQEYGRQWLDIYKDIEAVQNDAISLLTTQIHEAIQNTPDDAFTQTPQQCRNIQYSEKTRSISKKASPLTKESYILSSNKQIIESENNSSKQEYEESNFESPSIDQAHQTQKQLSCSTKQDKEHKKFVPSTPAVYEIQSENDVNENEDKDPQNQKPSIKIATPQVREWQQTKEKNDEKILVDNLISRILIQKENNIKAKVFFLWYKQCTQSILLKEKESIKSSPKPYKNVRLAMSRSTSVHKRLKESIANTPENVGLVEELQRMTERVSILEAELAKKDMEFNEQQEVLEESVKRETQAKFALKKLAKSNKSLQGRIQQAEKRYEDEVLQLMLGQQFRSDGAEGRIRELEDEVEQAHLENESLNMFIRQSKERYEREIASLNAKLDAAFDVAGTLRRKANLAEELKTPGKLSTKGEFFDSPPILASSRPSTIV